MLAFPVMLKKPAEQAGIPTPDNADLYEEYKELYPHFFIFCRMQLGAPMPYPSVHFDNAKIVASIPEQELQTITHEEIVRRGFQIGYSGEVRIIGKSNWFTRTVRKLLGVT